LGVLDQKIVRVVQMCSDDARMSLPEGQSTAGFASMSRLKCRCADNDAGEKIASSTGDDCT